MIRTAITWPCFILLILLATATPAAATEDCNLCHIRHSQGCDSYCAKAPSGKAECHQHCMRHNCGEACARGNSDLSPDVANEITDCQSCVEYMRRNDCVKECASSERRRECVSSCSKFRCSQRCNLPIGAHPERAAPQMNCTDCKEHAASACSQKCGDDKSRAGYTACRVSCVETRCLKNCNQQLF